LRRPIDGARGNRIANGVRTPQHEPPTAESKESVMPVRKAVAAITLVMLAFTARPFAQTPPRHFVTGEILVKFRPGASAGAKADAHRTAAGTVLAEIARTGVQRVAVAAGDEAGAIGRYQRNPNILYAEPNFIRTVPTPTAATGAPQVIPADYYFDEQWALHNTGQEFYCIPWIGGELCFYVGTPDADIDAPEAWAISTGSPTVSVAVIDTGIDYTHPDLAPNYAGGHDFVSDDNDPFDDHGHGTHVSGTIAAALNNLTGTPEKEEGIVGVAPHARLLAYKVCAADGTCSDFAIDQAIAHAVTDGAKVINMSLGGVDYSQSMYDAVQDAWSAGLVIVAGAGNDASNELFYPAAYDNVISVAAFDEDDNRASFSNYGDWIDLSAPGNVIMSAYPMSSCTTTNTPGDTGCYTWLSGTSMATPHVSGAAALVWSRGDVTTNSDVVDILLHSADPVGVAAVRLDAWTAHGGLNIHNALAYAVTNLPPVANAGADQIVTDTNRDGVELVTLDGSASSDPDGYIASYEWTEGATVVAAGATPGVTLPVGTHTITLRVTDDRGDSAIDTTVVTVNAFNDPPTAANTSATTVVGTPVTVTLTAADSASCELAFSVVQGPASGTLGALQNQACAAGTPNIDTAAITYTPATAGTYSFTYNANDGALDSNVATATITVNAAAEPLTVTAISPNAVSQNVGTVTFVIAGTGFAPGASVAFVNGSGPAPRVRSLVRDSTAQLTASVEIRAGGPKTIRYWDVKVTNSDGTSATGVRLLTITP
jgi:thermitase